MGRQQICVLGGYRDPLGKDTLVYGGGHYRFCGKSECPVGSVVTLDVISGHRDADVGHTACPGSAGEATLPALRDATVAAMGAGLVAPTISGTAHRFGDGGVFTVTAGAITHQSWALTATSAAGVVVRTVSGLSRFGRLATLSFHCVYGGPSRIRTYDFHRVKVALYR